jgi:hypothetical protein
MTGILTTLDKNKISYRAYSNAGVFNQVMIDKKVINRILFNIIIYVGKNDQKVHIYNNAKDEKEK